MCINTMRGLEVCWILYQSSHNESRGQKIFKSIQVSKVENEGKKYEFQNFPKNGPKEPC